MTAPPTPFLATRRGRLRLLLGCAVAVPRRRQFLDYERRPAVRPPRPGLLGAVGLAVFSAIATARTGALLAAHATRPEALTGGFQRDLRACAVFLLVAAVLALRAANTHGEPAADPDSTRPALGQLPAPELAD